MIALIERFCPFLIPYLAIARVVALVAILVADAALGAWFEGKLKAVEISDLKTEIATKRADDNAAALNDLEVAAKNIHIAAEQFNLLDTTLLTRMDAIRKDLKNAKPLPADCRPDAFRVRRMADAITTTNQTVAGQLAGQSVPASSNTGQ